MGKRGLNFLYKTHKKKKIPKINGNTGMFITIDNI